MAGSPQPINSPFGNKPGTLPNPVPTEGMETELAQATAQAIPTPGPGRPPGPETQAASPMGSAAPTMAAEPAPTGAELSPEDSDYLTMLASESAGESEQASGMPAPKGIESVREQLREASTRIKNSFAVTPKESIQVLKESGLFEDVRGSGKGVEVKRPGRGWEKFDREKFEIIGDTLDFARDAMEMVVEGGVEAAGTAAGFLTTAPIGGAGSIPANVAAGAVGAVTAKNAGDYVAQNFLGIQRDPERNLTAENAWAASFGAGFGWLGANISRRMARSRVARDAADKSLNNTMEVVNETIQDVAEVQRSGIKLTPDGMEFRLDPNVAAGGMDPDAKAAAKYVSDTDAYQNFFRDMGDSLRGAYDSVIDRFGALSGKDSAEMGKDFVLTAKDIRKAEGKLIDSYVQLADKTLRGKPQPAPRALQTVQMMKQELSDASGKMTVASILQQNPSLSESQAKTLIGQIGTIEQQLKNGSLTVDAAKQTYDKLTSVVNNTKSSAYGKPYGQALIDLKNAVRDDYVEMIEAVLPEARKGEYIASRGRYKQIMDSHRSLGKLLENENISRDVLSKKLFEGGDSYEFMQSAKTLIEETNPELWNGLVGSYFDRMRRNAMEEVTEVTADGVERTVRKYNWKGIAKNWKGLDPRVQDELMRTAGIKKSGMEALMSLGQKYQNADVGFMAKTSEKMGLISGIKGIISSVYGGGAAKGTAVAGWLGSLGKDGAAIRWLQQDGKSLEQVLRQVKQTDPGFAKQIESFIYNWTPPRTLKSTGTAVRREAEDAK